MSYLHHWQFWILYFIALYNHDDFHIFFCKIKKFIKERTAQIIRPILRGKDIKRYSYEWADKWVIGTFPTLKLNIDEYQSLKNYLQSFMPKIAQSGEKGCRKKTSNKWFETQDNIAYWNEFARQKISWQRVTQEPSFILEKDFFILDSMAFFTANSEKELKYLLALVNSKLIFYYFKNIGHLYSDKGFLLSNQYVERLPIPKIPESSQEDFIKIVDKILEFGAENKDTKALEERVDEMVYALYNLNTEEIGLIKSSFWVHKIIS